MGTNDQVTRDEFEQMRALALGNSQVLNAVVSLNERVAEAMEKMVALDSKLTDVQRSIVNLEKWQHDSKPDIDDLVRWRNNRKAVEGALGWLLDKGPTLGGIAVIGFWVLDNWSKKG